jgi:type IV pilus assembly protein PilM
MAAETGRVWAIDIGNNSLKALCLSTERGVVEVVSFDNIQHGKILSGGDVKDVERDELIALTLRKFVTKYDLSMEDIVISVPSQNSFARFVTLPPVESKRIPEMVKFEAVQQIPFGIDDVQWDWQLMSEPDSSEIKVGIFAIKNEVVDSSLENFNREDIQVGYVQMAPMALYNYILYDRPDYVNSDSQATVVLNIGAETTDLVVCTKSSVWQRCILIGGNAFTKAIADAFRLNFDKAEKLKRTAPVSKYARQIFQAMRPVFTELASEVQRSLNFYNSSEPNTKIVRVIALGGGTKMRGLLKYLQQTLQISVERPDSFKRLTMGAGVKPAKFLENVSDFGIVYGLALQGLGMARIESNLLPGNVARSMAWASKGKYFIAAACMLLIVMLLILGRTGFDTMSYANNGQIKQINNNTIRQVEDVKSKVDEQKSTAAGYETTITKEFKIFDRRNPIPLLQEIIISALPNAKNTPEQAELYKAFEEGNVEAILQIPRKARKQIFISNISISYTNDLANEAFGGANMWRQDRSMGMGGEGVDKDAAAMLYQEQMMEEYQRQGMDTSFLGATTQEEKIQGFTITIAGYSPYGNNINELGTLLDPHGVKDQPSKWGFVTRLEHLDDTVDGNSPFELYNKTEAPEQFSLEMKEVSISAELPPGIGVQETRTNTSTTDSRQNKEEAVLKDPMTNEIISTVPVYNEDGIQELGMGGKPVFQVNDHWFILNLKFIWKDAPEPPAQTASPYGGGSDPILYR